MGLVILGKGDISKHVWIKDTDPTPAPPLHGRGVVSDGANCIKIPILHQNHLLSNYRLSPYTIIACAYPLVYALYQCQKPFLRMSGSTSDKVRYIQVRCSKGTSDNHRSHKKGAGQIDQHLLNIGNVPIGYF